MDDLFRESPGVPKTDIRAPGRVNWVATVRRSSYRTWMLPLGDLAALALAWAIAGHLNRFYLPLPPQLVWWVWFGLPSPFWLFAVLTLLLFAYHGLYSPTRAWRDYVRSGQLISLVYLMSLVISYFYDPKLDAPRSLFFTAWSMSVALVIGFRLGAALIFRQLEQAQPRIPVFLLAPPDRLERLQTVLEQRSGCRIVGVAPACNWTSPDMLPTILASGAREVLAEHLPSTDLASALYWQLRRAGITLRLIPSSLEILHRRGIPEVFAGMPTVRVASPPTLLTGWDYRLKRGIDILGSALGLLMLAPVLVGVALAIKLTSPGPIFFRQERVGLQGRIFQIWKFRTMVWNAPALQFTLEQQNQSGDGVLFKMKQDPRITRVGRFLRRTSLDELPQLFNVLLGQMSLVGPRPLPLRDVQRFEEWHHIRHQVLPGITGLWQISGRSDIDDFSEVVRLDLYYIDHWSLNLDLDILVETCRIVLFGPGAY
ncbi:MAG: sugar transferase [Leptolyngbyaceae cyanobacterium bins.59]|nr:sugar transferase [Leptolyngbyaceae cyanobacterium bins.59]